MLFAISIHAPRAGSDSRRWILYRTIPIFQSTLPVRGATVFYYLIQTSIGFQSTLPVRGATLISNVVAYCISISIHAPRAGSDSIYGISSTYFLISIHAPRAGSDNNTPTNTTKTGDFNPRSPCGERLKLSQLLLCWYLFQSTLPVRGATEAVTTATLLVSISIHAPRAGSDVDWWK